MKLPPATLVFVLASVMASGIGARWDRAASVVLLPLGCLLVGLLFARIDIGVRYALPLWPLFILTAARVATFPAVSAHLGRGIVVLVLLASRGRSDSNCAARSRVLLRSRRRSGARHSLSRGF